MMIDLIESIVRARKFISESDLVVEAMSSYVLTEGIDIYLQEPIRKAIVSSYEANLIKRIEYSVDNRIEMMYYANDIVLGE